MSQLSPVSLKNEADCERHVKVESLCLPTVHVGQEVQFQSSLTLVLGGSGQFHGQATLSPATHSTELQKNPI
jgi:hypothetical protein